MKPYKIYHNIHPAPFRGSYVWKLNLELIVPKPKPKMPLIFISNVHPPAQGRLQWLNTLLKVKKE